jgi:hypothetical protein
MWANIVGILKTSYDHSYNRYILIGEQQKCNLDRKIFVRKIENFYFFYRFVHFLNFIEKNQMKRTL